MHKFIMTLEDYRMFATREEHRVISVEEPPIGDACISCEGRLDIHVQVKKSFSLPSVRLEAYRRAGLLDDHAELKVLREVEDDYLKADERRWVAYRTILESVSIFNIKLS